MATGQRAGKIGGLTLLELLVVVSILAVLATIAIRSTSDFGQQARYDTTQATLKSFRDAVIGPANQSSPDGTPFTTGFVSDMGRPPRASLTTLTFGTGSGSVPDLPELYSGTLPTGLKAYAIYNAASSNVVNNLLTSVTTSSLLNDTALNLGAGWRGPYLSKSSSSASFVDGWGKYLVSRNDLGLGAANINTWPTMLLSPNTNQTFTLPESPSYTATISSGWDVLGWFTQSGFEGAPVVTTDPYYGRFYSVVAPSEYVIPITVTVTCSSAFSNLTGGTTNWVLLAMYGPNPNVSTDASRRPLQCTASQIGYSSFSTTFTLSGANSPTIGTRVFRAWLRHTTTNILSRVVYFPIRPGVQSVNIPLP